MDEQSTIDTVNNNDNNDDIVNDYALDDEDTVADETIVNDANDDDNNDDNDGIDANEYEINLNTIRDNIVAPTTLKGYVLELLKLIRYVIDNLPHEITPASVDQMYIGVSDVLTEEERDAQKSWTTVVVSVRRRYPGYQRLNIQRHGFRRL